MAAGGETERIARFVSAFARGGRDVIAGPGDDNALVRPRPGRLLVLKVDQLVEGVHFGTAFRPEEIGHKALCASLSDLAAAGATPRYVLVALALPADHPLRSLAGIARGMSALARRSGAVLVGGNFSAASELSLAVTAVGDALPGRALTRDGARPGDAVLVSGSLGGAALGLRELAGGRPARLSAAARRQLRPTPRLALAPIAGRLARAAVDVSDGFLRDLGHLCTRSRVGAEVDLDAIPLAPGVSRQQDGLSLALSGGEDYELVLAVPGAHVEAALAAARKAGERLTCVGRFAREAGIRLLRRGEQVPTPAHTGHDHFPHTPRRRKA